MAGVWRPSRVGAGSTQAGCPISLRFATVVEPLGSLPRVHKRANKNPSRTERDGSFESGAPIRLRSGDLRRTGRGMAGVWRPSRAGRGINSAELPHLAAFVEPEGPIPRDHQWANKKPFPVLHEKGLKKWRPHRASVWGPMPDGRGIFPVNIKGHKKARLGLSETGFLKVAPPSAFGLATYGGRSGEWCRSWRHRFATDALRRPFSLRCAAVVEPLGPIPREHQRAKKSPSRIVRDGSSLKWRPHGESNPGLSLERAPS